MVEATALQAGRVYRSPELRALGVTSAGLRRLLGAGEVRAAGYGLYYRPRQTFFGTCAPSDEELLRVFLRGDVFCLTGSSRWNALGLGTTQYLPWSVVYNRRRTGEFWLDGRPFRLRRVGYPDPVVREWGVVDLLNNETLLGEDPRQIVEHVRVAVRIGRLDGARLAEMVRRYGSRATRARMQRAGVS